jgi:phosphoribosylformylglycinamidine synthase
LGERIVVGFKSDKSDPVGKALKTNIQNFLGIKVGSVSTRKVYTIEADLSRGELAKLAGNLFVDQVTERGAKETDGEFDWLVEVGYKPGVTDTVGLSAASAMANVLKRQLRGGEGVYTSTQYLLDGVTREEAERIANGLLANPLIEGIRVFGRDELESAQMYQSRAVRGEEDDTLNACVLECVSDEKLVEISKSRLLSLSLDEMKIAQNYFARPEIQGDRKTSGLEEQFINNPTDVEVEVIAQTWSEHCKHKIFNAVIAYSDDEGKFVAVDSLFNTFIKGPSLKIASKYSWVVSAFYDNAGVVRFNDNILVADKIETHNAPSGLDPYGGAITGILGVNRDILGVGLGAAPMLNVFGFCFGSPFYDRELPEKVLHPRRARDGVHKGVIAGGNESGIALAGGWEFFDERFMFRPLVFCGTIGIMPHLVEGKPSHMKRAHVGDQVVMVGGKVGKDGIHGATFSSAGLDKESPIGAVQIGDSITQKKMSDFLLEARDLGLYRCITDNGAGGLSSSVGEMAKDTNGCRIDLRKAPLKYKGLLPWEILVSESQERMTVAVDPARIAEFLDLAKRRGVEATVLGDFQDSGKFHVTYGDKVVAHLNMGFLHEGLPKMSLNAKWKMPVHEEPKFERPSDMNATLTDMLGRLNIASKEKKLRQYDHEVKGLSAVKPLVGRNSDFHSDATISMMEYGSREGLIVAHAVNPHYSDIDTYHMAASVIDEGIRRVIAVGGKLPGENSVFYALDNFCWNLSSLEGKDAEYKLAQLVRANMALRDYCEAFGVPCISGKDSMKNVWKITEKTPEGEKERLVSIPPTLLFSTRAKIDDVSKAVTMDVKKPGDLVYVVGETHPELGGSEYFSYIGEKLQGRRYIGNEVPKVDAEKAKSIYRAISRAVEDGLIASAHTPTIGGLGVALAESAAAGGYGMEIGLDFIS